MTKCKSLKTSCNEADTVKSLQKMLDMMDNDDTADLLPISKNDIKKSKKALEIYLKECNVCAQDAANDYKCHKYAKENLNRRLPGFANMIYPWKNYDWDYGNHVSNNYAPKYTGATKSSKISALYKNVLAFVKVVNGLVDDPIPNSKSVAGKRNRNSDYPPFDDCDDFRCIAAQSVKNGFTQKAPTKDKFLKKKLDGEYSSSYYVKIGGCPRHDLKTQESCELKGFTWTPNKMEKIMAKFNSKNKKSAQKISGSCSQPRYMFIDNSPKTFFNGSKMKGLLPSLGANFMALSPEKVFGAAMGMSSSDHMVLQQCPETFTNYKKCSNYSIWKKLLIVFIISLLGYYLISLKNN
jgi:hypothetical protein